ncbi:MAG: DUF4190 domain-containing protein [Actinomycetota bacterium]|nr:DUF4190 domain-containing protein [Actinomycetota bacterium]
MDRADYDRPVAVEGNGSAVAAFVLGMLALSFIFMIFTAPAGLLFGLIALILGFVGSGKAKRLGGMNKGLAVTGIITGLLAFLLGIAGVIGGVSVASSPQIQRQIESFIQQYTG